MVSCPGQQTRLMAMKYYTNWRHYIVNSTTTSAASRYKRLQIEIGNIYGFSLACIHFIQYLQICKPRLEMPQIKSKRLLFFFSYKYIIFTLVYSLYLKKGKTVWYSHPRSGMTFCSIVYGHIRLYLVSISFNGSKSLFPRE